MRVFVSGASVDGPRAPPGLPMLGQTDGKGGAAGRGGGGGALSGWSWSVRVFLRYITAGRLIHERGRVYATIMGCYNSYAFCWATVESACRDTPSRSQGTTNDL